MIENERIKILVSKYNWSEEQIRLGLKADFKCEYCRKDLIDTFENYDQWQIDHIIPKTSKINIEKEREQNKAVSCKICNYLKRNWDRFSDEALINRKSAISEAGNRIADSRKKKSARFNEMKKILIELKLENISQDKKY